MYLIVNNTITVTFVRGGYTKKEEGGGADGDGGGNYLEYVNQK